MNLSPLGFGGAPIGNLFRELDDETAIEAVRVAYQEGIRYFDTAPHYGLGLSERRLGAALHGLPRDSYTLSTKVGRLLVPVEEVTGTDAADGFAVPASYRRVFDYSRDGVRRSLAESLARLGTDRVDLLLLHDPDEHWRQAIEEGIPALVELREQGVIGGIGVGMNQAEMLADFVRRADLDVLLLAGRYTLLEQGAADDLLPLCQQRGVAVVIGGVFNSGLLATDRPDETTAYNYAPPAAAMLGRARRLAAVCAGYGVPLPAAAIRFAAAHPAVASVLLGCHTAEQVRANLRYRDHPIPDELWARLRAEGLIR